MTTMPTTTLTTTLIARGGEGDNYGAAAAELTVAVALVLALLPS